MSGDSEYTRTSGHTYVWRSKHVAEELVASVAAACDISPAIARVLISRGYETPESAHTFLHPAPRAVELVYELAGAREAVERIERALEQGEKILVFGDYDVDGITSTSLLLSSLMPLGANINYYLPHRIRDGYGLNVLTVERAVRAGYRLIITVDNGISAYAAAERAHELGIDLIITDHHKPHATLPNAPIIVDPQLSHCRYPFKYFAGVGVIFKLMELLYHRRGLSVPERVSELLLLGTVADVVPLLDENRYWVQHGLRVVNRVESTAFRVLKMNGSILHKTAIDSLDIGFMIAPQLNALGRLDDPRDGVMFLMSADEEKVARIGQTLAALNSERKRIDQEIYRQVVALIETGQIDLSRERLIMAMSPDWPPGVIGLVAGKLMHAYGRPAILLHETPEGIVKGSCRSIEAYNMFNALSAQSDILRSFGGHAAAAGLSLKREDVPLLKERLEADLAQALTDDDLVKKITIEGVLTVGEIVEKFITSLARLEPFGQSNRQPLFRIDGVTLVGDPQILKEQHVKCVLRGGDERTIAALFFGRADLYDVLRGLRDRSFSLAGHIVKNEWRDTITYDIHGVDILYGEAS